MYNTFGLFCQEFSFTHPSLLRYCASNRACTSNKHSERLQVFPFDTIPHTEMKFPQNTTSSRVSPGFPLAFFCCRRPACIKMKAQTDTPALCWHCAPTLNLGEPAGTLVAMPAGLRTTLTARSPRAYFFFAAGFFAAFFAAGFLAATFFAAGFFAAAFFAAMILLLTFLTARPTLHTSGFYPTTTGRGTGIRRTCPARQTRRRHRALARPRTRHVLCLRSCAEPNVRIAFPHSGTRCFAANVSPAAPVEASDPNIV